MPVSLDLGCGQRKVAGATGTDVRPLPGVDVVHDLTRRPYPFATSCADEVHLNHVLEHMPDAIQMLEEVWRITKPGAKVLIRVPHYTGPYAWKDPTHVRCFTSESFDYFGSNRPEPVQRSLFITSDQARISSDVGCQDRSETTGGVHAASPAASRKPDSKSSRSSGLRQGRTLGTI